MPDIENLDEILIVKPRKIRIDTTAFCQLKCPACPMTFKPLEEKRGYLHVETLIDVFDKNPWIEEIELINHGEMFLNPDLVEILRVCHERNVIVTADVGVNLNNVKDAQLEALVKYRVKSMKVSIDGASQETYEQYRVGGNFDKVIANVKRN